jgi:UDP-GlcNAc3NAcA epimerase
MSRKKIITIIGARPQIIKAAAISRAIKHKFSDQLVELIVHTGQHYDENMSAVFFTELNIPQPNFNLEIGSGSHASQTGKMLIGLEEIFLKEKPDAVLVYGDTNSTVAGALAASKIHIPLIHVEAGLRSFNKAMPEEINRIACDHMSTLLFTPTASGIANLIQEGFSMSREHKAQIDQPLVTHSGDVMFDNSIYFSQLSKSNSKILELLNLSKEQFILCTIHRDTNTDHAIAINSIFSGLLQVQKESGLNLVLPLHPRTRKKMEELLDFKLKEEIANNSLFQIIDPVGFLDIIALEENSKLIITDSGGLQKEAYFFKKPCVILREQTEWVEIVDNGNALLAGTDTTLIVQHSAALLAKKDFTYPPFYGDAHAAEAICEIIIENL